MCLRHLHPILEVSRDAFARHKAEEHNVYDYIQYFIHLYDQAPPLDLSGSTNPLAAGPMLPGLGLAHPSNSASKALLLAVALQLMFEKLGDCDCVNFVVA